MNFSVEVITKDKMQTSIWSGGKTNEIYIYPRKSSYEDLDFKWRLSTATVEQEHSTFTKLPGVIRYITTLDEKIKILHNDKQKFELKPYEIHKFLGDDKTESFGKCHDLNLMLRENTNGDLRVIDLDNENKLIASAEQYRAVVLFACKDEITVRVDDQVLKISHGEAIAVTGNNFSDLPDVRVSSKSENKIVIAEIK